jgi:hypothetical protein
MNNLERRYPQDGESIPTNLHRKWALEFANLTDPLSLAVSPNDWIGRLDSVDWKVAISMIGGGRE